MNNEKREVVGHTARHTAASRARAAGVTPQQLLAELESDIDEAIADQKTQAHRKTRAQLQRLEQVLAYINIQTEQITPMQLLMLVELAQRPGQTCTELAAAVGAEKTSATTFHKVFGPGEGRKSTKAPGLGWVSAKRDPDDERKKLLKLTEEGKTMLRVISGMLWP